MKRCTLHEGHSTVSELFPSSHLPSDKAACSDMTQPSTPSQGFTAAIALRSILLHFLPQPSTSRHVLLAIGRHSRGENKPEPFDPSSCGAQGTQHRCDKKYWATEAQKSQYITKHGASSGALKSMRKRNPTCQWEEMFFFEGGGPQTTMTS